MESTSESQNVSRSGRVRKKSSRLAESESPDKMNDEEFEDSDLGLSDDDIDIKDEPLDEDFGNEFDENDYMADDIKDEDDDDDDDDDNLQIDEDSSNFSQRDGNSYSQANSLYLSEKLNKKNVTVKDGQLVPRKKASRKDKGVSRFTAYMLWAREARQNIADANPNMDFSAVNKRLGEMWALVPNSQKFNWKRKAKRMAKNAMISTGKQSKQSPNAKSNLINKGGVKPATKNVTKAAEPAHGSNVNVQTSPHKTPVSTPRSSRVPVSTLATEASPPSQYKVNGCTPIDAAAHLKLLGESLNNIGQKLKEYEGQIAVSGSLSILLDSMLCVLGPLTCLSNQIEELRGAVPDETLTSVLDNIAYIMPGIV